MNKRRSLLFAVIAIVLFALTGAALGNQQYLAALISFLGGFIVIGWGMRIKRKQRESSQDSSNA